jgi:prepilin-type N-terminal cleavage/methylation domain-containing protein
MHHLVRACQRAFTLIELMVVIALLAVILMLAAPQMTEMIGMQRLKAINDQLIADFQFLRSEAVSRNQFAGIVVRNISAEPMSCYVLFSSADEPLNPNKLDPDACNCTSTPGSACGGTQREMRVVQIPRDLSIELKIPPRQFTWASINPATGGMQLPPPSSHFASRNEFCVEVRRTPRGRLRTGLTMAGRPTVCSPDGSVRGVPVCPAYDINLRNCPPIP